MMIVEKNGLIRWGSSAGIAGAITFLALWGMAIIVDGHWIFGIETLSELGGDRPGRLFFNSAAIIMGVATLLFAAALYRRMRRTLLEKVSTLTFAVSSILLVGVGLFPIDTGAAHTFFSWSFFIVVIVSLTLMFFPCQRNMGLRSIGTIALTGVLITAYVTMTLVALDIIELALSEALIVIALNIWEITNGFLILFDQERQVIPCVS